MGLFLEIAVAAPINHTLTYSYDGRRRLQPGLRLLVPLGPRRLTGYLLDISEKKPQGDYPIKAITDILDQTPVFPANMISFYRWIADYYHYPLGEVIKGALPGGLACRSGREILLTTRGEKKIIPSGEDQKKKWLLTLCRNKKLPPRTVGKLWRGRNRRILLKWQEQGLITINEVIIGPTCKAKTEICVGPVEGKTADNLKKSEQKTLNLLTGLLSDDRKTIPRRDITRRYSGAGKALKSLAAKKIIFFEEKEVYRDPFGERPPAFAEPNVLSCGQKKALAEILPAIKAKKFKPFLLHGITGSGKTEVYLRGAQTALKMGRTVLVMVPEIALAAQIEGHFFSRFGSLVAVLHSGLSKGERFDQWQRILRGRARVVIGARSAIFAPLADPGLIIVDEEHDPAYKQEDLLRYQARDLAILRASQQHCPVILGSATPSLVSYHNAGQGKYQLLNMKKRIHDRPLPKVEIINLRKQPPVNGRPPLFSPQLIRALTDNLKQHNQSMLFLNRRGFANLVICRDCGHVVQCRNCRVSLTMHKKTAALICHYCGYTIKSAVVCPNCRSGRINEVGFGTERVEIELKKLFPQARIGRLDRDTTTKRADFIKILKEVREGRIDILVGTQMITKGHHFPNMTLVGIIWADGGLGMPDFRAGERTFQLLSQVSGRAGRGEKEGRVIVQTHQPDHYSITTAGDHDYQEFFSRELSLRASLNFPPYGRLINIKFSGKNEDLVKKSALELYEKIKEISRVRKVSLLGPAPAPLARIRRQYRWQLLLKGNTINSLHEVAIFSREHPPAPVRAGKVKLFIDVDPENML